jgi:hypothetical protein
MNSNLAGKVFIYRSRSFKGTSIDDQADAIKRDMFDGERVSMWKMSHEKTGELMTLNQKHGLPFSKFGYYKSEDGVAQWQHFSRADKSKPNSFNYDFEKDGEYQLGDCELYYIVDDDQVQIARDDKGHKLLRDQVSTWEYVPVKITDSGQTVQKPSKINDDVCDATKGLMAYFQPGATKLTQEEALEKSLPETLQAPKNAQQYMAQQLHLQKQIDKLREKEWEPSRF